MRAILENIEATIWSQLSVVLFSAMFIALTIWVFLPSRRSTYMKAAQLPLEQQD